MSLRTWLFRIILCLVLGVVTTVGVAWALALYIGLYSELHDTQSAYEVQEGELWYVRVVDLFGGVWIESSRHRYDGPHEVTRPEPIEIVPKWTDFRTPTAAFAARDVDQQWRYAVETGWPFLAMRASYRATNGVGYSADSGILISVSQPSPTQGPRCTLPVKFAPTGFTFDAALYTGLWGGLLFGPGSFKRWNHKRRGLCPMCKYNLRGNPEGVTGCAECGWNREDHPDA